MRASDIADKYGNDAKLQYESCILQNSKHLTECLNKWSNSEYVHNWHYPIIHINKYEFVFDVGSICKSRVNDHIRDCEKRGFSTKWSNDGKKIMIYSDEIRNKIENSDPRIKLIPFVLDNTYTINDYYRDHRSLLTKKVMPASGTELNRIHKKILDLQEQLNKFGWELATQGDAIKRIENKASSIASTVNSIEELFKDLQKSPIDEIKCKAELFANTIMSVVGNSFTLFLE